MNDTFMKEKPILPLLTSMALPMVISMLVNSLYNIVDSFFVAQINEQAMTALSLVFPVQNFVNATAIGFGVGINAMIALHLGAGNKESANASATHGMILSIIHGFLALIISITIMPTFLGAFTKDENVIKLGLEYSRIVFLFAPVIMISLAFEKIFQAVGRMNETMFALLCGCISNIILDPMLIFGIGFFPKLGIKGAALATGIGQVITVIIYLVYYVKKPLPVKLKKSCLPLHLSLDLRLYTIGVPAILNLALPSFLVSFLNGVLSVYSDIYVVVLGIYYKLQTFLYLPASGIVQGMRPIIGYNYGAGEMKRVSKIFRLALLNNSVSDFCKWTYRNVLNKSRDHPGRWACTSHHQRRIYRIQYLRHSLRRTGRARKRRSVIAHFTDALCCYHHASCLYFEPYLGCCRSMECILDYRTHQCSGFRVDLPPQFKTLNRGHP